MESTDTPLPDAGPLDATPDLTRRSGCVPLALGLVLLWLAGNVLWIWCWRAIFSMGPVQGLLGFAWFLGLIVVGLAFCFTAGRARSLGIFAVVVGAALGYLAPTLGPALEVWRHEAEYLERVQAALADPAGGDADLIDVDGAAPVVAFYWLVVRGDVDGIVYDPAGRCARASTRPVGLSRQTVHHLYGPWYYF